MTGLGNKMSSLRGSRNGVRISNSVRGVEATALTSMKVNNEIAFCKVYNIKQKEEIERRLLKNRISYFIKWQEKGVFRRMFDAESKEKNVFIICIHDTAVDLAKELVADMSEIKLLVQ